MSRPKARHREVVYVIVRHTRAGDQRVDVVRGRSEALARAEGLAEHAAANYGVGRTSVFKGLLTYSGIAEKP